MNILLVDVDSEIANLALMKVSAFHKARSDQVAFTRSGRVPIDQPHAPRHRRPASVEKGPLDRFA